jgi:phosphoribosylaminoimidazolecarboxamide formyltransferase / IMP cyclohydrolase
MMSLKRIENALISVFDKEGLEPLLKVLTQSNIQIYSTGGTQKHLEFLGIASIPIEDLTDYPSIFGGRVKTLHPKVFGGILYRRSEEEDLAEAQKYKIPKIDLVIVDLYPFELAVKSNASEEEIIEKIDIGGVSLLRAAAKNYEDVVVVSSSVQYEALTKTLEEQNGETSIEQRMAYATKAFESTSYYDSIIFQYFNSKSNASEAFRYGVNKQTVLRYGENPHQKGSFYGNLDAILEQLHGKELSFNNLVDLEAAISLVEEFQEPTYVIIKHTNPCGVAVGKNGLDAYLKALAGDPVSAFGGVIATNTVITDEVAKELDKLFFEVLIAPDYHATALKMMKAKKRILLRQKGIVPAQPQFRTLLNGLVWQDKDVHTETLEDLKTVTESEPTIEEAAALLFANKIVKHAKSNAIVLSTADQLLGIGVGQTSRVDALKQAAQKAIQFGFELNGSVMASDAFFPFPDCVVIAHKFGIRAVIQPGGSIRDQESIDFCNQNNMSMVFTGYRHFKH